MGLKEIIQFEHNIVKNSNWPEANQLDIYKRGRGFELWATKKQKTLGSGQSRTRVRHLWIASLTGRPLDHVASNNASNNDIHEIKCIKSRLQSQRMLGYFS